jgi:small subunit ribosomal protein S7e
MMQTNKLANNKKGTTVNEITKNLTTVLHKIQESDPKLKADLESFKIESATEIIVDDKNKCLLIKVDENSIKSLHKVHAEIVKRLEDHFSGPVVIVPERKKTNGNLFRKFRGKKAPRNRTLTAVYQDALEDVLFPSTIVGLRTRYPKGNSRIFKVQVDPLDKELVENKSSAICAAYTWVSYALDCLQDCVCGVYGQIVRVMPESICPAVQ